MPIGDQMPRQDDDLLTRVAALEKQLSTVTGIAATAASVKQNLVSPAVNSASSSNFTVSTSYTTYASFNFTVPTGFTRVLIVANGFVHQATASGSGEKFWGQIVINGTGGPESTAIATTSMVSGAVAVGSAASLSGLTAGATLAVSIQGHFQIGGNSALWQPYNSAEVTAAAVFLS